MDKAQRKDVIISSERVGNKEHVYITDSETGEVIDDYWQNRSRAPIGRPKQKPKGAHFSKLYMTNLRDIVRRKNLTPYEAGVFFMCISFMGWESNFLVHPDTGKNLSCNELAKLTGVNREQMSRTLDKLTAKGLIATVKNGNGMSNNYMLNSNVVFWGQKIKDKNEHDVFGKGCPYKPPVKIKYEAYSKEDLDG